MLNINNCQRNANYNHNEVSLRTCQNGHYQEINKQQMLVRMWRKQTLVHCCWECRLVQPLWKTEWNFLKKLKMEMFYVSAILLLGIHLKRPKTLIWKNISTPMFIAALLKRGKIWKQPNCPSVDEWIKMLWLIYTAEYYSAVKKNTPSILTIILYYLFQTGDFLEVICIVTVRKSLVALNNWGMQKNYICLYQWFLQ